MTDLGYFIGSLPCIKLIQNQYYFKVNRPIYIYGNERNDVCIPLDVFTQSNKIKKYIGGVLFEIELSSVEEEGHVYARVKYLKNSSIGFKEKHKILQHITALLIGKEDLILDYSIKEYFFEPENLPKPTYSDMVKTRSEEYLCAELHASNFG